MLKSGMFSESDKKTGEGADRLEPLDDYNMFLDLDVGGEDITSQMTAMLQKRPERADHKKIIVLADTEQGTELKTGPGVKLVSVKAGQGAKYWIENPNAYLTSGRVRINPRDFSDLSIKCIQESPENKLDNMIVSWVYIADTGKPAIGRIGADEASRNLMAGGGDPLVEHLFWLPHSPRWVLAREVVEIRVTPGIGRDYFYIDKLALYNEVPP
jgi:hypothetical protein